MGPGEYPLRALPVSIHYVRIPSLDAALGSVSIRGILFTFVKKFEMKIGVSIMESWGGGAMYLTPDQFRDALEKGLGRAVLHIREHGAEGLREHLLHACLHNVAHDTQLEGDRSGWLLSMIDLTGEEAFYHERIFEKIEVIDEAQEADRKQLLCFAREFAKCGHEKFRQIIYKIFDSQKYDDYDGDKEIVELDGVKGLLHVADTNGLRLRIDPDCYWGNGYLLNYAIKELGFSEAVGDLKKHSKNNTNMRPLRNSRKSLLASFFRVSRRQS